ncbi:DUF262 domain-containing protein [Streptomyces sp. NPDC002520]
MTRQTSRPLEHHNLRTSDRSPREIATSFRSTFGLDLAPDYQRGDVWTEDQRVALILSWLTGTPTGVVILNDRTTPEWKQANGYDPTDRGEPMYACIDQAAHHHHVLVVRRRTRRSRKLVPGCDFSFRCHR